MGTNKLKYHNQSHTNAHLNGRIILILYSFANLERGNVFIPFIQIPLEIGINFPHITTLILNSIQIILSEFRIWMWQINSKVLVENVKLIAHCS